MWAESGLSCASLTFVHIFDQIFKIT